MLLKNLLNMEVYRSKRKVPLPGDFAKKGKVISEIKLL